MPVITADFRKQGQIIAPDRSAKFSAYVFKAVKYLLHLFVNVFVGKSAVGAAETKTVGKALSAGAYLYALVAVKQLAGFKKLSSPLPDDLYNVALRDILLKTTARSLVTAGNFGSSFPLGISTAFSARGLTSSTATSESFGASKLSATVGCT